MPRRGALAEKEIEGENPPWTPLSLTQGGGGVGSQDIPSQQPLDQEGWCSLASL